MSNTINQRFRKPIEQFRITMLEIVLALVVVVLGIVGLIGILPVGLDQHKGAMGTGMAVDAAEQFLHFNASKINEDWSYLEAFPDAKPSANDTQLTWSSSSLIGSTHVNIKFPASTVDETFDPSTHGTGIFLLEQLGTGSDGETFVEFGAVLRMWKSAFEQFEDGSAKATLCVEVSWAAEKPYDIRQKEVFCLEVYKSPSGTVQTSASPCVGTAEPYPSVEIPEFDITRCCPYYEIAQSEDDASEAILDLTYYWTDGTSTRFTDLNQMEGRWDGKGNWITQGKTFSRTNDSDPGVNWETFVMDETCSVLIMALPGPGNTNDTFEGGIISPSGSVLALKNGSRTFAIIPDESWAVADVLVDGESVGAVTSYTFQDVGEVHHDIKATFSYTGNQAPIANADTYVTDENVPLMLNAPGILSNDQDMDETDILQVDMGSLTEPVNGDIQVFESGSFTYAPPNGWSGTDTFTYRVTDSKDVSGVATVTITVNDVNTPPVAADDSAETAFEQSVTIDVLVNDNDDNGDTITIGSIDTSSASGSASVVDGMVSFTPNAGFDGVTTFTYVVNDGSVDSAAATVTVTVLPSATSGCDNPALPNPYQAPTFSADTFNVVGSFQVGEESTKRYDPLVASYPSGYDLTYTLSPDTWLSCYPNASHTRFFVTGTPPASAGGHWNAFTLTATDGCESDTTTIKLFVEADTGNNCPVWKLASCDVIPDKEVNQYFCVNLPNACTWIEVDDSDDLEFSVTSLTDGGDFLYWTNHNQIAGTPTAAGTYLYEITVSDGTCTDTATFEVPVLPEQGQECPVWPQTTQVITNREIGEYFCVNPPGGKATDENPEDELTYTLTQTGGGPTGAVFYITPNKQVAGIPIMVGEYTYTLEVSDGSCTSTANLTIVVDAGDPVPCGPRFNPGNSAWQFCLVTPSGTYTRSDLHGNDDFSYSGPATSAYFKPIAGGGSAIVNGELYPVQNGKYYLFTGNLNVDVSTTHPGSMGHWEICVSADSEPEFGSGGNRPASPCE